MINGSATIIIPGLNCQETYTVNAGGTVNGTLLGPRSFHENITTGDCQIGMQRLVLSIYYYWYMAIYIDI